MCNVTCICNFDSRRLLDIYFRSVKCVIADLQALFHNYHKGYMRATWRHGSQPVWLQSFNRLLYALANQRKMKLERKNIPVAMRATCVYHGTGPVVRLTSNRLFDSWKSQQKSISTCLSQPHTYFLLLEYLPTSDRSLWFVTTCK